MNSPEATHEAISDEPTSDLVVDELASVTATSEEVGKDEHGVDELLKRVANLKMAPKPSMDDAYECASAIAENIASNRRTSGEMRRAFEELLTTNSEMLHRRSR